MKLSDLLGDAASAFPDVETVTGHGGEVTWSCAGRPFALLSGDGGTAEFGLDAAVAAAAARTPDVVPSGRGPGWVRFQPVRLDDHGADRATAWFVSAHRRLAGG